VYGWYRLYGIVMHIVSFFFFLTLRAIRVTLLNSVHLMDFIRSSYCQKSGRNLYYWWLRILILELSSRERGIVDYLNNSPSSLSRFTYSHTLLLYPSTLSLFQIKRTCHYSFSHEWRTWLVQYINTLSYNTLHLHIDCVRMYPGKGHSDKM